MCGHWKRTGPNDAIVIRDDAMRTTAAGSTSAMTRCTWASPCKYLHKHSAPERRAHNPHIASRRAEWLTIVVREGDVY